jgi:hypothetical protein
VGGTVWIDLLPHKQAEALLTEGRDFAAIRGVDARLRIIELPPHLT